MSRKPSLKVDVEPKVLKWIIDSSGWDTEDLVSSMGISENTYYNWLKGASSPTIRQLEQLATKTKRPLAAFFLPEPDKEKPHPKDYRMIPSREGKFDRKTIIAIRKARHLHNLTKQLSANINETLKPKVKRYSLDENPKEVALFFRNEIFKLSEERQTKFKDDYKFYNFLREVIEDLNIIPFQISMPVEDARGFALVDEIPMVIVVNSKDSIRPRIFSLMHEFAHVLLGESGVSYPDLTRNVDNKVENWCDTFASEFILPEDIAKDVFTSFKATITELKTLKKIANRYYVSKGMLMYNLNRMNFIPSQFYKNFVEAYHKKPEAKPKENKKGGGGVPSETRCMSEMGTKFVSLVAENYDKGFITYADALNYLSIKSSKFNKLLSKAIK